MAANIARKREKTLSVEKDEVEKTTLDSFRSTFMGQSAKTKEQGLKVKEFLDSLTEKENEAGTRRKRLFDLYGDPTHMLRSTKKQIQTLTHKLDWLLLESGSLPYLHIATEPNEITNIEIHEADTEIFAYVDMTGRTLPFRLVLMPRESHHIHDAPPKYLKTLPDDLVIYFSCNHGRPDSKHFDKKIAAE